MVFVFDRVMMTSSNGNIFRVTGHLCGEFTGLGILMFSSICARINCWVNNRGAGDLRRHRAPYDVIVMWCSFSTGYSSFVRITDYRDCNPINGHQGVTCPIGIHVMTYERHMCHLWTPVTRLFVQQIVLPLCLGWGVGVEGCGFTSYQPSCELFCPLIQNI